ncbi:MAG: glycosyl hydrolase family 28-related protein, partial [Terracidiphilus sp.]
MKRTVVQYLSRFVAISIAIAALCVPIACAQAGINITYPSTTGVCNVTSSTYGATGNGTTDDTAAIQKALNDANCHIVYLPNGTYRLTAALSWPYYTVHYGSTLLSGYKSNRFNWLQISPKSLSQS